MFKWCVWLLQHAFFFNLFWLRCESCWSFRATTRSSKAPAIVKQSWAVRDVTMVSVIYYARIITSHFRAGAAIRVPWRSSPSIETSFYFQTLPVERTQSRRRDWLQSVLHRLVRLIWNVDCSIPWIADTALNETCRFFAETFPSFVP